jgi:hypothetical protein
MKIKEEILSIASDLREGSINTDKAKDQLLALFMGANTYTTKDMDNAYDKGFKDGIDKYRMH